MGFITATRRRLSSLRPLNGFALDGLEGQDVGRQRELDFAPAGHDLIGAVLAGFGGHADIGHTPPQGFAHAF